MAGTTIITANQSGNDSWYAAIPVSQVLVKYKFWAENYWNGGAPLSTDVAIIAYGAYECGMFSTTPSLECGKLIIKAGAKLIIEAGYYAKINEEIENYNGVNGIVIKSETSNSRPSYSGSLIHKSDVSGTVQRVLTDNSSDYSSNNYHLFGSPIRDINTINTTMYSYYETDAEPTKPWFNYTTVLIPAIGYLYYTATDVNKTFTGVLNQGNYTVNLAISGELSQLQSIGTTQSALINGPAHIRQGMNLVSNPYPSTLNLNAFYLANINSISKDVYVWNQATGSYLIYDLSISGQYLAPCQGFFVKGINAESRSVTFTNAMRVTNTVTFKSLVSNHLKLKVSDNNRSDETVLHFTNENSGADKMFSMISEVPQIYIKENTKQYAIARYTDAKATRDVAVNLSCSKSGTFTLSVADYIFDNDMVMVIEDLKTKTKTTLSKTSSFTFEYIKGDKPERFVIHINPKTSDSQQVNNNDADDYLLFPNPSDGFVNVSFKAEQEVIVEIYTLNGSLKKTLKISEYENEINISDLPSGVYQFNFKKGDKIISKKFIKY